MRVPPDSEQSKLRRRRASDVRMQEKTVAPDAIEDPTAPIFYVAIGPMEFSIGTPVSVASEPMPLR